MEAKNKVSRHRSKNWTLSELEILIDSVDEKKDILTGSFSSSLTNSMKTRTWQEIAEKISANSVNKRETKEVKKKWMDYKSQTRKKVADRRRELVRTGGGSQPIDLTDIEQRVVSIIPQCQIEGCSGGLDSEDFKTVSSTANSPSQSVDVQVAGTSGSTPQLLGNDVAETRPKAIVSGEAVVESQTQSKPLLQGTRQKRDLNPATKTNDSKVIVDLETEKVSLLRDYVDIQRERLTVERRSLEIKEEKLRLLKGVNNSTAPQSPFFLSPIIKLL